MYPTFRRAALVIAATTAPVAVLPLAAQTVASNTPTAAAPATAGTATTGTDTAKAIAGAKPTVAKASMLPPIEMQHYRPQDARGLNVFEPPKDDTLEFTGFKLAWGAAFTQQFQGLTHHNTAAAKVVSGVNANQLIALGHGFNNATANLYMNAQLAKGVRVALTTYLSARHHQESWVKDGYLLVDASPLDVALLNNIMKYVTLRVGHFELDYGDAHYRRSDNGNTMYNPLVGNYIMDAFTTEIGAEAYVRANGVIAMFGMTGGEVHGQVTNPSGRAPTFLGKLGFDRKLSNDLRVRLTGSMYETSKTISNTLYSGDRAGSRYYDVMENTTSTETANAWSGAIQPGFKSKVQAFVVNPFVKYQGLELFGNIEKADGRAVTETSDRAWRQNVGEVVYRFLDNQFYVAGRYNTAKGQLAGIANTVSVNRTQAGGGWFLTPSVLLKGEYVIQRYNDFPTTDIRNGGRFNGFVMEGVVAF